MTSPSATLLISINGGSTTTGGITGTLLDTVDMSAQSTIGWAVTGVSAPRWEIYGYPPSFSVPSGYSTDGVTGAYYYVGLTPPQFTMTVWGKYMLRLIVNGGGGSLTDESTSVRVYAPSGLDDLGRYEKAQFSQDWTDGYRANLRIINSGLGVAKAPADAQYLVGASNADLTNEVVWTSIVTTVAFASTATIPCSFKRTSATTNAVVDAHKVIALSSGTAVVGFGVGCVYQGANTSGAAIDYGRIKFTADDLTGGSESTRMVVQCTTAGSMVNAFEVTGTSAKLPAIADGVAGYVAISTTGVLTRGTGGSGVDASAHVWEDASTALATNGVPTRNLAASLSMSGQSGVVPLKLYTVGVAASDVEVFRVGRTVSDGGGFGTSSTIAHMAFALPNGSGTETKFAAIACQLTSTIGPSGKMILRTLNGGSMSDWVTIGNAGAIRFHGSAYANNGYRLVVDGSGNITASVITFAEVQTALGALASGVLHSDGAGTISSSAIVNADVDAAAGIVGTKISPDFGAQNITTTGSVTAGTNGFIGPKWDRATAGALTVGGSNATSVAFSGLALTGVLSIDNSGGTLTIGANTTGQTFGKAGTTATLPGALSVAQATTHTAAVAINIGSILTTSTDGLTLAESTAADAGNTVRYSPRLLWSGRAWVSSADTTMRVHAELQPRTSGNLDLVFRYDTGGGTFSDFFTASTSDSSLFVRAIRCGAFCASSGSDGFRFAGGSNGGMAIDGSGNIQVKSSGTQRVDLMSTIGTATATAGVRSWNNAGTRSAGWLHEFGDGSSFAQKAGVAYDGVYEGPLGRCTSIQTANYTASFFEVVRCSFAGGGFTVKLPDPIAADQGKMIWIKNEGSSTNTLTLTTVSGSVSIDDAASKSISGAWFGLQVICTGANGYIMFPHS